MDQYPDRPNPFAARQRVFVVAGAAAVFVIIAVSLVAALVVRRPAAAPVAATVSPVVIQVTANGFVPETVAVKAGRTVEWRNDDTAPHVVASNPYPQDSDASGLHSKTILPGGSYTYTATSAGTIGYHDDTQPALNGTLTVKE